jgi:hypothetical protein
MATSKAITSTPTEITALACRLRARADSVLLRDQPEQQSDMQTAARLIEHLVHLHTEVRTAAATINSTIARLVEQVTGQ